MVSEKLPAKCHAIDSSLWELEVHIYYQYFVDSATAFYVLKNNSVSVPVRIIIFLFNFV